jgi:hypothetical protein
VYRGAWRMYDVKVRPYRFEPGMRSREASRRRYCGSQRDKDSGWDPAQGDGARHEGGTRKEERKRKWKRREWPQKRQERSARVPVGWMASVRPLAGWARIPA